MGLMFRDWQGIGMLLSFLTEGNELTWSDAVRYLGVYIVSAKIFCCSFKETKIVLRAFNAIVMW